MSIGLTLDIASMHNCKGLAEHAQSNNNVPPFICTGFVTENLSSVHSLFSITIIKDLKVNNRRKCNCLLNSKRKKGGGNVEVTNKDIVSILTMLFEDANKINKAN